jgi:hypothetical protein
MPAPTATIAAQPRATLRHLNIKLSQVDCRADWCKGPARPRHLLAWGHRTTQVSVSHFDTDIDVPKRHDDDWRSAPSADAALSEAGRFLSLRLYFSFRSLSLGGSG